ncbi:MAG TPA: diadenylate cyclase CdaA [Candidatus Polarisedimenticolia bacterium]|nr:diadenylate cyclase CdaA [Candidatus Polarisedimenticolia bacterium]
MTPHEILDRIVGFFVAVRASPFGWLVDVADIVILAYLIYQLVLLIKGTRAVQMMAGVVFIISAYFVAGVLQLNTVQRFLGYLLYWIPFAVIVIFQNTIRRALSRFGRNPFFRLGSRPQSEELINELVLAATSLASRKTGGLIVIEREQGLRNYIETGITIDALLSYDLILSIFSAKSPLHDGAIIVQEGRIRAASCFLPLTSHPTLSKDFGTRHRAAIGVSEETDAVAVVISEERGTVSVAFEGRIIEDVDAIQLRDLLKDYLGIRLKEVEPEAAVTEGARER